MKMTKTNLIKYPLVSIFWQIQNLATIYQCLKQFFYRLEQLKKVAKMDFGGADSLFALSNLLSPPKDKHEDLDDDDDIKAPRAATKGLFSSPADVKPMTKEEKRDLKRAERTKKTNPKDIWDVDEVMPSGEYDDAYDSRQQPEYSISYRQTITTDDVYLGMSNKNPSTASCEMMVIKIELPEAKSLSDMDLNVKKTFLDLRTPIYRLGLHLPHPCDDKSAKAQWDSSKHELVVTLRMKREFDELNF